MKVKLLTCTSNPIDVMWVAARTCYSAKSPIEMWETNEDKKFNIELKHEDERDAFSEINTEIIEKHWNLVKKVLDSGHQSVAEHVYFTFAIEGISRACSHQLVRHRAGIVFSQQSQRYVEIKEDIGELVDLEQEAIKAVDAVGWDLYRPNPELLQILEKYFTTVSKETCGFYLRILLNYLNRTANGMKPEDARQFLLNATKTNLTMTVNYRELIHICNLRLCTRAQKEIRDLFKLIKEEVEKQDERLASYLVPQCEVYDICFEHKGCGRKPKLEAIKDSKELEYPNTFTKNGKEYEVRKVKNKAGEVYWIICEQNNPEIEYASCSATYYESPADMILWFMEREEDEQN